MGHPVGRKSNNEIVILSLLVVRVPKLNHFDSLPIKYVLEKYGNNLCMCVYIFCGGYTAMDTPHSHANVQNLIL